MVAIRLEFVISITLLSFFVWEMHFEIVLLKNFPVPLIRALAWKLFPLWSMMHYLKWVSKAKFDTKTKSKGVDAPWNSFFKNKIIPSKYLQCVWPKILSNRFVKYEIYSRNRSMQFYFPPKYLYIFVYYTIWKCHLSCW